MHDLAFHHEAHQRDFPVLPFNGAAAEAGEFFQRHGKPGLRERMLAGEPFAHFRQPVGGYIQFWKLAEKLRHVRATRGERSVRRGWRALKPQRGDQSQQREAGRQRQCGKSSARLARDSRLRSSSDARQQIFRQWRGLEFRGEGAICRLLGLEPRAQFRVAADENLHYLFYRDLATSAIDLDASAMIIAIEEVVRTFAMPGTGIVDFDKHSAAIARAGIYDATILHEQVLVPVILNHWRVQHLEKLSAAAERARDALVLRIERLGKLARAMADRASRRQAALAGT